MLSLCVLASGSAGNAALVRSREGSVLVDLGLAPRTVGKRMAGTGLAVADVSAAVVTHLDRDHFNPLWVPVLIHHGIRLFVAAAAVDALLSITGDRLRRLVVPFGDDGRFSPLPGLGVTPVPVAHDDDPCHAFRFASGGANGGAAVGYATDLGHVPPALLDAFCGVGVLAVESNYDPALQRASGRPAFLQRRITGGRGHLSNEQAATAVRAVFDRCARHGRRPPRHVVLLHRSRQCNCPHTLRRTFAADPRLPDRLTLAEQDRRTEWIDAADPLPPLVGEQMTLAF